jgi:hypothetical protein
VPLANSVDISTKSFSGNCESGIAIQLAHIVAFACPAFDREACTRRIAMANYNYSIVPIGESADKYLALVERIRANLADLYDTGRWRRYYSEAELLARARELATLQDKWADIAERSRRRLPAIENGAAARTIGG